MRHIVISAMMAAGIMALCLAAAPRRVEAQAAVPTATRCPKQSEPPQANSADEPPPAGVPLLMGVQTGMTRTEVRQINRFLVSDLAIREFELLPGLKLKAAINFRGTPERSVSVEMNGAGRLDKIVSGLTRSYGRPLLLDRRTRFIDVPVPISGGVKTVDFIQLKWCDGGRQFILSGEPENYWLSIRAIRL